MATPPDRSLRVLPLDPTACAIRAALSPELLRPRWRLENAASGAHPLTGHCYVATEAYYHLRGRALGFVPHVWSGEGKTHWWLQNAAGEILDLTAEQFADPARLYPDGRGSGFLTRQPSRRAQTVMDRVVGPEAAADTAVRRPSLDTPRPPVAPPVPARRSRARGV